MELIFYDEAARIIGVTTDSLRHAVSRGELTRAGRQKRNVYLIKEQVELFKGRKISYESLSPTDKALWHRYAKEVSQTQPASAIDQEAVRQAIRQEADELKSSVKDDIVINLIESLKGMLSHPKSTAVA